MSLTAGDKMGTPRRPPLVLEGIDEFVDGVRNLIPQAGEGSYKMPEQVDHQWRGGGRYTIIQAACYDGPRRFEAESYDRDENQLRKRGITSATATALLHTRFWQAADRLKPRQQSDLKRRCEPVCSALHGLTVRQCRDQAVDMPHDWPEARPTPPAAAAAVAAAAAAAAAAGAGCGRLPADLPVGNKGSAAAAAACVTEAGTCQAPRHQGGLPAQQQGLPAGLSIAAPPMSARGRQAAPALQIKEVLQGKGSAAGAGDAAGSSRGPPSHGLRAGRAGTPAGGQGALVPAPGADRLLPAAKQQAACAAAQDKGAEEGQEEDEEEWSDAQDSWEDEPIEAHLAAAGMQVPQYQHQLVAKLEALPAGLPIAAPGSSRRRQAAPASQREEVLGGQGAAAGAGGAGSSSQGAAKCPPAATTAASGQPLKLGAMANSGAGSSSSAPGPRLQAPDPKDAGVVAGQLLHKGPWTRHHGRGALLGSSAAGGEITGSEAPKLPPAVGVAALDGTASARSPGRRPTLWQSAMQQLRKQPRTAHQLLQAMKQAALHRHDGQESDVEDDQWLETEEEDSAAARDEEEVRCSNTEMAEDGAAAEVGVEGEQLPTQAAPAEDPTQEPPVSPQEGTSARAATQGEGSSPAKERLQPPGQPGHPNAMQPAQREAGGLAGLPLGGVGQELDGEQVAEGSGLGPGPAGLPGAQLLAEGAEAVKVLQATRKLLGRLQTNAAGLSRAPHHQPQQQQEEEEDDPTVGMLPITTTGDLWAAIQQAEQQLQQLSAACSSARLGQEAAQREVAQLRLQEEQMLLQQADMQLCCQRYRRRELQQQADELLQLLQRIKVDLACPRCDQKLVDSRNPVYCLDGTRCCEECADEDTMANIGHLPLNASKLLNLGNRWQLLLHEGNGPLPASLLEQQLLVLPQQLQDLCLSVEAIVQECLEEEVVLRASGARAGARAVARNVRVRAVAAANVERQVGEELTRLGYVHDILAAAGEGAGPEELRSQLQAASGATGVMQEVQKLTLLIYVDEGSSLLLTHALLTATLRNKDGSCGWGSHSAELCYLEGSGQDLVGANGLAYHPVIRATIKDVAIAAWALTVGACTLTINTAAPGPDQNWVLRARPVSKGPLSDPALYAGYHALVGVINRIRSMRALSRREPPPSFESYSRTAAESLPHCWMSGSATLGSMLYAVGDQVELAMEVHQTSHWLVAKQAQQELQMLLCGDGARRVGSQLTAQRQRYRMAAANLRATAAEVAVEEAWPDLHPEKQVQVVVQPVCHVTQVPLAVLPQGLAGAAAGAAHSGASLDSDGASSSSSTGGSGGSEAAADALQVTGYMVPRCGSSIRNLVVPVHSDAPWRYGNVQLADKPNVVFATQALADAAAAAAGVAAVPVLLEEVQGVRSLPQFHPGSPFLTNTGTLSLQYTLGLHFMSANHARAASMAFGLLALRYGPMEPVMCAEERCNQPADGVGLIRDLQLLRQPSQLTICSKQTPQGLASLALCPGCMAAHQEQDAGDFQMLTWQEESYEYEEPCDRDGVECSAA